MNEEMPMYEKTMAEIEQTGSMGISATAHRPTLTELLKFRKADLEKELSQLNNAIAIATEQEGAMKLIDAIAKTGVSSRL